MPLPSSQSTHPMVTRSKSGIIKPRLFQAIVQPANSDHEPTTVQAALLCPDWKQAMEEEYHALMRNQTWTLVPSSSNF